MGVSTVTVVVSFEGWTQDLADRFMRRFVEGGELQRAIADEASALDVGGVGVAADISPARIEIPLDLPTIETWEVQAGGAEKRIVGSRAEILEIAADMAEDCHDAVVTRVADGTRLFIRA